MFLKKISIFISIVFIISNFSPLAYAGQAVALSDEELDGIYAAGIDININSVEAFRSAVVAQSNIAAVTSLSANTVSLTNSNFAQINNVGNSAVAAQSNIAAVVARSGDINNATINNTNVANINNSVTAEGFASASSLNMGDRLTLGQVYAAGSAVASQSNIAVLAALNGGIYNSSINNFNNALVENWGGSALASQINIGVAITKGGPINGVTITNSNVANVGSTDAIGTITNSTFYNGTLGNVDFNLVVNQSAVASQINIAVIAALSNNATNTSVTNHNIATVYNLP